MGMLPEVTDAISPEATDAHYPEAADVIHTEPKLSHPVRAADVIHTEPKLPTPVRISPLSMMHQYSLTTLFKPRWCEQCSRFLRGVRHQGYQWSVCFRLVCAECSRAEDICQRGS